MTAPGNNPLFIALTLSILMSSAYALGRIHQWHRHGLQRDEAYHRGYDKASLSILSMMTRHAPVTPVPGRPGGRHTVGRGPQLYPLQRQGCDPAGT